MNMMLIEKDLVERLTKNMTEITSPDRLLATTERAKTALAKREEYDIDKLTAFIGEDLVKIIMAIFGAMSDGKITLSDTKYLLPIGSAISHISKNLSEMKLEIKDLDANEVGLLIAEAVRSAMAIFGDKK